MEYIIKFIFYLLRKTLLIFSILLLIGLAFFASRDIANVYIVVNEGLKTRTMYVLDQNIDRNFLDRFFTEDFIRNDSLIDNNVYDDFSIYDYRQRIRVRFFTVWPWENTVQVYAEHIVTDLIGEPRNIELGLVSPPEWESGLKRVTFVRREGSWQISEIYLAERIYETAE